jgi:hypothetical protein
MPPTTTETSALALWVGVFQVTTPVLVMTVPWVTAAFTVARKRRTSVSPGCNGAEKSAVIVEPTTVTPAVAPFHRRGAVHVGEAHGQGVRDQHAEGRDGSNVDDADDVLQLRTRSTAPPPTTVTCLEMESCWPAPTTTTVGSGPVAGLPSPSVSRSGRSTLSTTAWLLIRVPAGCPG